MSLALFDDPDSTYVGEKEIIKNLNEKLEKDPNYILPEAYKKIYEKELKF